MAIGRLPPTFEAHPDGNAPSTWGDAAGWVNTLTIADDPLLAKSEQELRTMHQ